MDVFLAFPLLVFAIALAGVIPDTAFGLSGDALRIALLIFIIGFFSWPYIGRIVRGQTLSLREREFVDAARSLGARGPYIIFKEMLPNLVAPILVYATLLIPTNILFEAALSFLGVGIRPPTASWGGMLSEAATLLHDPALHVLPGHGDLHHRAGLQPVRRRAARRARPQGRGADTHAAHDFHSSRAVRTRAVPPGRLLQVIRQGKGAGGRRRPRWHSLLSAACGGGE